MHSTCRSLLRHFVLQLLPPRLLIEHLHTTGAVSSSSGSPTSFAGSGHDLVIRCVRESACSHRNNEFQAPQCDFIKINIIFDLMPDLCLHTKMLHTQQYCCWVKTTSQNCTWLQYPKTQDQCQDLSHLPADHGDKGHSCTAMLWYQLSWTKQHTVTHSQGSSSSSGHTPGTAFPALRTLLWRIWDER